MAVEVASGGEEVSETGARLRKATFLFFLPPPSIWSICVVNKVIMEVKFWNISFMEGSSPPEVQSDSCSEVTIVDTFFFMALPFLADRVVALFLWGMI